MTEWELLITVDLATGNRMLAYCWWEKGLHYLVFDRHLGPELIAMIEADQRELLEGKRLCDAVPPPTPPVRFNPDDSSHMAWFFMELDNRPLSEGRIRAEMIPHGRWDDSPLEDQVVY